MRKWWRKQEADLGGELARDIRSKLAQLENKLDGLAGQKPDYHIHVENLHVQNAVLEQMTVRLDHLDIEEISGALNIGNNFHTLKESKGAAKKDREQGERAAEPENDANGGMNRTSTGYRFRYAPESEA